ncbi:uncharacterized protein RJT20DRAFT_29197 [Scheffersomyces xylosifermentans]|uniref:uncharacterized protein n=1 Tax=Scheffersomyces xylosifermentans TaxID=1304137 RepID=UPI00315D6261
MDPTIQPTLDDINFLEDITGEDPYLQQLQENLTNDYIDFESMFPNSEDYFDNTFGTVSPTFTNDYNRIDPTMDLDNNLLYIGDDNFRSSTSNIPDQNYTFIQKHAKVNKENTIPFISLSSSEEEIFTANTRADKRHGNETTRKSGFVSDDTLFEDTFPELFTDKLKIPVSEVIKIGKNAKQSQAASIDKDFAKYHKWDDGCEIMDLDFQFADNTQSANQVIEKITARVTKDSSHFPEASFNIPKPVTLEESRFKVQNNSKVKVSIMEISNAVSCLDCSIDYHGYTGVITNIRRLSPYLINRVDGTKENDLGIHSHPKLEKLYNTNGTYADSSCVHHRVKYDRDISDLHGTISYIVYKTSAVYSMDMPYEPQYYRFEIDNNLQLINESKSGLCPYCEEVKFLPFKNSSYLSHLTLEHGIFSNNYLTPEGLYFGRYKMAKKEKAGVLYQRNSKDRSVDAILCPICFELIEVGCWSFKANKLLSYFRHFKSMHAAVTTVIGGYSQLPIVKPRGRTLHVLD